MHLTTKTIGLEVILVLICGFLKPVTPLSEFGKIYKIGHKTAHSQIKPFCLSCVSPN